MGPIDAAALPRQARRATAARTAPPNTAPVCQAQESRSDDDRDRGAPRRSLSNSVSAAAADDQRPPGAPRCCSTASPSCCCAPTTTSGFADHPRIRDAAADAARRWGVGAGASRLVSGTMTIHRPPRGAARRASRDRGLRPVRLRLPREPRRPRRARRPQATRSSPTSSTTRRSSTGAGSRARDVVVYRHRDMEHLAGASRASGGRGEKVIATDSVFSMDGDLAPLEEIVDSPSARRTDGHRRGPRRRSLGPGRPRRDRARRAWRARSTSWSEPSARRSAPTVPTPAPARRWCAC